MPFTTEELIAMQEEEEKEQQSSLDVANKEKDSDGSAEVKDKKEEGSEDGNKEGKEGEGSKEKSAADAEADKVKEGAKEKEVEEKEKVKEEEVTDDEEKRELREIARSQKLAIDKITKDYDRLNKLLKDKGLVDEEDEKLQKSQVDAARLNYESRLSTLNDMLEVMKVNPKFEDIETVVSQRHFDDMTAALAKYHVSQKGGDILQVTNEVERKIWSLANPYKYMYDMIKKYHPDYVTKEERAEAKKEDEKVESESAEKKADGDKEAENKPKEQAMSLQDLPGGGSKDGGGWTSAKIDAMDEDELSKVPTDIYEKYLKGTLQ